MRRTMSALRRFTPSPFPGLLQSPSRHYPVGRGLPSGEWRRLAGRHPPLSLRAATGDTARPVPVARRGAVVLRGGMPGSSLIPTAFPADEPRVAKHKGADQIDRPHRDRPHRDLPHRDRPTGTPPGACLFITGCLVALSLLAVSRPAAAAPRLDPSYSPGAQRQATLNLACSARLPSTPTT